MASHNNGAPEVGMDPRFSLKVYPRKDNIFKHKSSLNFDQVRTKVYIERKRDKTDTLMEWFAFAIVGVLTGFTAAIMSNIEETVTVFRRNTADDIIGGEANDLLTGWLFFAGLSAAFVLVASLMTVFWGPGANGSGIAELIAYLNGINYPKVIGFETFVTKTFGVVFAVVGGLCVGKEGPLAHIGGNIGAVTAYLPFPRFKYFQNDQHKRLLIAAGTSAGVSAAFGAPVGGTLFAFEISKPNVFWKFSVIWKVFFSCALSVFTLAIISSLMDGQAIDDVSSAVLKFGTIDISPPTLAVIPGSIAIGAMTGVLGGLFVLINSNLGLIRKKYITSNPAKICEAVLFSVMTTTTFYWLPAAVNDCYSDATVSASTQNLIAQYNCKDGYYSPLATMFLNTEGDAIRSLISGFEGPDGILSYDWHLVIFAAAWYFWTIVTYGVWVPAGLFLPGIIIGCAVGGCYSQLEA